MKIRRHTLPLRSAKRLRASRAARPLRPFYSDCALACPLCGADGHALGQCPLWPARPLDRRLARQ